ncbi:hypothetical protein EOW77_0032415 [Bradyrhizobium yuanmingense]|uniref:hypothetical protein n=1 Tax=Bradyrhizobium yuanmingense TaxID=108015 RepID=UPI000FE2CCF1|nr:hypothetical protein [Bradyrhizobium yuanmingense]TGN75973.1 hypothetical protein EOW77_0032415 [Bradyrhizobium yuanmingense]
MDDPKLIDLEPHKWRSDRPKPREPIFGAGIANLLAIGITVAVLLGLSYFVRGQINAWWPSQAEASKSLPPGNYTWNPEKGLQKSD